MLGLCMLLADAATFRREGEGAAWAPLGTWTVGVIPTISSQGALGSVAQFPLSFVGTDAFLEQCKGDYILDATSGDKRALLTICFAGMDDPRCRQDPSHGQDDTPKSEAGEDMVLLPRWVLQALQLAPGAKVPFRVQRSPPALAGLQAQPSSWKGLGTELDALGPNEQAQLMEKALTDKYDAVEVGSRLPLDLGGDPTQPIWVTVVAVTCRDANVQDCVYMRGAGQTMKLEMLKAKDAGFHAVEAVQAQVDEDADDVEWEIDAKRDELIDAFDEETEALEAELADLRTSAEVAACELQKQQDRRRLESEKKGKGMLPPMSEREVARAEERLQSRYVACVAAKATAARQRLEAALAARTSTHAQQLAELDRDLAERLAAIRAKGAQAIGAFHEDEDEEKEEASGWDEDEVGGWDEDEAVDEDVGAHPQTPRRQPQTRQPAPPADPAATALAQQLHEILGGTVGMATALEAVQATGARSVDAALSYLYPQ